MAHPVNLQHDTINTTVPVCSSSFGEKALPQIIYGKRFAFHQPGRIPDVLHIVDMQALLINHCGTPTAYAVLLVASPRRVS